MKISALVLAALITGTTFATTAMAQRGGVGGTLNLRSTVKLNGKLTVKKNATAHLANTKLEKF